MCKLLRLLLTLGLAIAATSAFAARPMTFMDVLEVRNVAGGVLSRDGAQAAYTVDSLHSSGKRFKDIWIASTAGGPPRQLSFTPDRNETDPVFSPDGQWLAYHSDRPGKQHVFLLPLQGGEPIQVSQHADGAAEFAFSPDGRWLAYLEGPSGDRQMMLYDVPAGVRKTTPKRSTGVQRIAWTRDSAAILFTSPDSRDEAGFVRGKRGFDVKVVDEPEPPTHLWRLDLGAMSATRLTQGSDFSVSQFAVSPDGRWVTFKSNSTNRYADSRRSEAWLLPLDNPQGLEQLTRNEVPESLASVSPDGKWVALEAPDGFTPFRDEKLMVRSTAGGQWRTLPKDWGEATFSAGPEGPAWSADSSKIFFTSGKGLDQLLFEITVASGAVRTLTPAGAVYGASYHRDSDSFLLTRDTPAAPADYHFAKRANVADPARWNRLGNANPGVSDLSLGTYEAVQWKSTDGRMVEGILVKPVGWESGKRYPLIVQIHGGPAGAYTNRFSGSYSTYVHVYANAGYAVFQPNYRGSTNYGEKFRMQIAGDYFRQAFDDIMAGVDELVRRGVADPDKLGMMGWSAGGHWSNWTLTHTDRFKAISSGAGAVNWISMYAQTDVQAPREFYFAGKPYDNWDHYLEVSPLKYIRNAKTPTLIHCGDKDPRVPIPQSQELHMALKQLGVPTEFIVYPGMPHGLTNPRYQLVKMVSEFNWFEKWIRGQEQWLDWQNILDMMPAGEKKEEPAAASATSDEIRQ